MTDVAHIIPQDLESAVGWLYRAAGMEPDAAASVAAAVVAASARGIDSHGIVLVPRYIRGLKTGGLNAHPRLRWVVEAGAVAELDADNAP